MSLESLRAFSRDVSPAAFSRDVSSAVFRLDVSSAVFRLDVSSAVFRLDVSSAVFRLDVSPAVFRLDASPAAFSRDVRPAASSRDVVKTLTRLPGECKELAAVDLRRSPSRRRTLYFSRNFPILENYVSQKSHAVNSFLFAVKLLIPLLNECG